MSELIQEKKIVTFEELCPKWSKSIQTGIVKNGLGAAFSNCIVGEANGFKGPYNCSECNKHATSLVNYDNSIAAINLGLIPGTDEGWKITKFDEEAFEQRKDAFMKHWNLCHLDNDRSIPKIEHY